MSTKKHESEQRGTNRSVIEQSSQASILCTQFTDQLHVWILFQQHSFQTFIYVQHIVLHKHLRTVQTAYSVSNEDVHFIL